MSNLPSNLTLLPTPQLSSTRRTALFVNIPADVLQALKKSNGSGIKLSLGPKIALKVGDRIINLADTPLSCRQTVYQNNSNNGVFQNVGTISHKLSVSSTTIVKPPKSESPEAAAHAGGSTSRSPSRLPPASSRSKFLQNSKPLSSMSINSAPLRAIHLLAIAPISSQHMVQRTKISLSEVENLLKEYGRSLDDGTYTLADKAYKYLRVWERKYSEEQRESVIANSIKAFDRLQYSRDHPARRKLVAHAIQKAKPESAFAKHESKERAKIEIQVAEQQHKTARGATQNASVTSPDKQQPAQNYMTPSSYSSTDQKVTKNGKSIKFNGSAYNSSSCSNSSSGSESESISVSLKSKTLSSTNGLNNIRTKSRLQPEKLLSLGTTATSASSSGSITPHKRKLSISQAAEGLNGSVKRSHVDRPNGTASLSTAFTKPRMSPPQARTASVGSTSSANTHNIPFDTASCDKDMFALAQKFREKYTVYAKLYHTMSTTPRSVGATDRLRVQELVSMHKELASVKKRLWQMSPSVARSATSVKNATGRARAGLH